MGQREDSRIWKILEILKSELVNLFGLYAVLEEREVNTFKGSVFTLPKSFSSSSKPDRAGFKCLLLFPTGHFCLGTRAHTEFQYQWDTTSNAALNWQHSWVDLHVYQLSRSKVCRHWVEQQYATKLTVVLLEKKKIKGGGKQLSVQIKAPGPIPQQTMCWFVKYRISRSGHFRKSRFTCSIISAWYKGRETLQGFSKTFLVSYVLGLKQQHVDFLSVEGVAECYSQQV